MRPSSNTVRDGVGGVVTQPNRACDPLHVGILLRCVRGYLPRVVARRVDASRDVVSCDTTDVRITDDKSVLALRDLKRESLIILCRPGPRPAARHFDT